MEDTVILKRGSIEITTRIARFGPITFQVSNIGSVATYLDKRFNIFAIILFIVAVLAAFLGFDMNGKHCGEPQVAFGVAIAALVLAIIIQMFWPRKIFTFVLKTSSNDVHKIISEDGAFLESVHGGRLGECLPNFVGRDRATMTRTSRHES
jgi:uncharacterized membrane protein YtjA (UPF0391 family)